MLRYLENGSLNVNTELALQLKSHQNPNKQKLYCLGLFISKATCRFCEQSHQTKAEKNNHFGQKKSINGEKVQKNQRCDCVWLCEDYVMETTIFEFAQY